MKNYTLYETPILIITVFQGQDVMTNSNDTLVNYDEILEYSHDGGGN